jgi:hypothetical protein
LPDACLDQVEIEEDTGEGGEGGVADRHADDEPLIHRAPEDAGCQKVADRERGCERPHRDQQRRAGRLRDVARVDPRPDQQHQHDRPKLPKEGQRGTGTCPGRVAQPAEERRPKDDPHRQFAEEGRVAEAIDEVPAKPGEREEEDE